MKAAFKPKKAFIHVPGFGVVSREDFGPEHTAALLKRAEKAGVDRDKFISQHLVISGYGDLEIFSDGIIGSSDDPQPPASERSKGKKGKKNEVPQLDDEAELEKLIAEEEAEKA